MNYTNKPSIIKAHKIIGNKLVFRDADFSDAEFILSLRTDATLGQHLSFTSTEIIKQIAYLKSYRLANDQAYFIIENLDGCKLGTVRLYDPRGKSFCWGSWILQKGSPHNYSIESALIVYAYAIDNLGFKESHFDVRKGNRSVWRFHEKFGAIRIGETKNNYLYKLPFDAIKKSQLRYTKYLPMPLDIV